MPRDEDEDLSFVRALADDIIISMAERDPAHVAKVLVDVCERLAAERHYSMHELQTAIEALLLEWQELLRDRHEIRADTLTEHVDRALAENRRARKELKQ